MQPAHGRSFHFAFDDPQESPHRAIESASPLLVRFHRLRLAIIFRTPAAIESASMTLSIAALRLTLDRRAAWEIRPNCMVVDAPLEFRPLGGYSMATIIIMVSDNGTEVVVLGKSGVAKIVPANQAIAAQENPITPSVSASQVPPPLGNFLSVK